MGTAVTFEARVFEALRFPTARLARPVVPTTRQTPLLDATMTRAIVTYDGVSRTIVVEPNRRVSFVDIVESGVDATSENGPGAPVALYWAWLEAGFDVLHQLGELDSGDSLQPRIDTLLDGVRRIAEAPDGEWAHVHVPGLVTMLAAHPTVRSRLAVSDHPELRRVDLAVAWALGSHPEREWVMLRDPVLASRLRRLDQRGASTDEYLASVAAYRSRRPPPLRSWLWDGERMAVWKSLPRSVKRQVGDNFGVSVDDLAALWVDGTDHHRDAISVRDGQITFALSQQDLVRSELGEYVRAAQELPQKPPGLERITGRSLMAPAFERRLRTAERSMLAVGATALGIAAVAGVLRDGWLWWAAAALTLIAGGFWAVLTPTIESEEHYGRRLALAPVPFSSLVLGTVAINGDGAFTTAKTTAVALGTLGLAMTLAWSVRAHLKVNSVRNRYPAEAREHARDAFLSPLDPVLREFLGMVSDSSFASIRENVLDEPLGPFRAYGLDYAWIEVVAGNRVEVGLDDYVFGYLDRTEYVMPFDAFVQLFSQYEAICRPDGDS